VWDKDLPAFCEWRDGAIPGALDFPVRSIVLESAALLSRRFPSFVLDIQSGIWLNATYHVTTDGRIVASYPAEMQVLRLR
jgi:hypothetical protein